MIATCDMCHGEYEAVHQCRVVRDGWVITTYISPPVPLMTRVDFEYLSDFYDKVESGGKSEP